MALPTIRGTFEPQLQHQLIKFDPSSGFLRELEYRGLGLAEMQQLANAWSNLEVANEISYQFGVATLKIIDSRGEERIDKWELELNKLSPSSLENPRNLFNVTTADMLTIAKMETGELTYDEAFAKIDQTNDFAVRLINRMKMGSNQYYRSGYVLKHTTNVANRYDLNIADRNVDYIYTTAQMLSESQDSSLWIFPLPGELVYAIQYYDSISTPAPRDNYQWGWLKSGSSRQTAVNNRVDITTEFEIGQWTTDEYYTVT